MASSEDELILRVRGLGLNETAMDLARVRRETEGVGTAAATAGEKSKVGFGLLSRGIGGIMAAVGISGAVVGIKDTIEAGLSLQRESQVLQATLDGIGVHGKAAFNDVFESAMKLAEHGGFARPEELTSITNFIGQLHNVKQAEEANLATVELARAKNLQWGAAQMAVSRALAGNTTRLAQYIGYVTPAKDAEAALTAQYDRRLLYLRLLYRGYGTYGQALLRSREIQLKQQETLQMTHAVAMDKAITAQQILSQITKQYPNVVQKYNQSVQGMASNLKNSVQIMVSDLGESLIPEVKVVLQVFKAVFDFLDHNKWILTVLATAAGAAGVGGALFVMAKGVRMVYGATTSALGGITRFLGGLLGLRTETEQVSQQELAFNAAMERVRAEGGMLAETLDGLTYSDYELAASAAAIEKQMLTNLETLAEWRGALATTAVEEDVVATGMDTMAVSTGVFAAALDALPLIGLITLVTIGLTMLITHWKTVERGIVAGAHMVVAAWKVVEGFFIGLWHTIEHGFMSMWHHVENIFNPSHIVHGLLGLGRGLLHGATFGLLSSGGPVRPKYYDMGGPVGTDTIPGWLSPGEYVLNSALTQQIGVPTLNAWSAGGYGHGQNITIQPSAINLRLDSRLVAQGVVRYTLERAARGPSSLSGGSLVTGSGGGISMTGGGPSALSD